MVDVFECLCMNIVPPRLPGSGLQRQRPFSFASGPSTTVTSTRCSQQPSSQMPSRRPARCAVMSLVPLSAPLDSWTSSSEFPVRNNLLVIELTTVVGGGGGGVVLIV